MFVLNLLMLNAYGITLSLRLWVMVIKDMRHNRSITYMMCGALEWKKRKKEHGHAQYGD